MGNLHTKTTPVGIDKPVQKLQQWFTSNLPTLWGIDSATYASYGRAYVNERGGRRIPEVYTSDGDYIDVFANDNYNATSFFYVESPMPFQNHLYNATVNIVFFVKLDKVYPSITHRADEEVHNDILSLLQSEPYGFRLNEVHTGIDSVYADFDFDDSKKVDMSSFHVVRFVTELTFNNYQNC